MTHKKFWNWFKDPTGNLITDRGRFSLLQVDEVNRIPVEDFRRIELNNKKIIDTITVPDKPEIIEPETFWQKLKRKHKSIIDLLVGVADLFTRGAASKIEKSIDAIFTDDTEDENINSKKIEGNAMLDTLKNFLTGFIVRWVLKIGGGFLLSVGVTEGSLTEIVTAVVAIVIGLVISLFQQKKALETDLNTINK